MRLVLVRHAQVTVDRRRAVADWHLSPEGRAAADALAREPVWDGVDAVATSPEPKAAATAQRIAAALSLPLRFEPDLREVEGRAWVEGGYSELARRHLGGGEVAGWEPRAAALDRVRRCIDRIAAARPATAAALVSHGLVLTLYVSDALSLDASGACDLWSRLAFPDVLILDTEARRLERGPSLALTGER
jgi:broad specificity phosphatase PhoE